MLAKEQQPSRPSTSHRGAALLQPQMSWTRDQIQEARHFSQKWALPWKRCSIHAGFLWMTIRISQWWAKTSTMRGSWMLHNLLSLWTEPCLNSATRSTQSPWPRTQWRNETESLREWQVLEPMRGAKLEMARESSATWWSTPLRASPQRDNEPCQLPAGHYTSRASSLQAAWLHTRSIVISRCETLNPRPNWWLTPLSSETEEAMNSALSSERTARSKPWKITRNYKAVVWNQDRPTMVQEAAKQYWPSSMMVKPQIWVSLTKTRVSWWTFRKTHR